MMAEYIPYGPDWEAEMKKLPKSMLIEMLREQGKECDALKDEIENLHYAAMGEDL